MPTFELEKGGKTYEVEAPNQAAALGALPHIESAGMAKQGGAAPSSTMDAIKEGGKGLFRGAMGVVGSVADEFMEPFRETAAMFGVSRKGEKSVGPAAIAASGAEASPKTTAGKYAGNIGEVAGNPLSYIGPGSLLLKGGAAVLSGAGSEAAGELVEGSGSPALEAGARMVGSLAGPAGATAAAERNLTRLAAQLPTRETIRDAARAGYRMLEQSDTRISPQGTQDLLSTVQNDLHASNFRDYLAPQTYRAIEELAVNGSATIGDLDGVRKILNRVPATNPTDREAARRAIDAIDNYLSNVPQQHVLSGDPARDAAILRYSQHSWAIHKQLETIEDASVHGQHRAGVPGSGANRVNTARQEIRKILDSDKKSRGMSQAARDQMEEIVMGTWLTNGARRVGKFAPSGPVSASTSILMGMGAGPGAGAAVAGGGFIAKHLAEYLTDRQIRELEALIRIESPIGRPIAQANAPAVAEQRAVPAASLVRSALTNPSLAAPGADSALSQPPQ